MRSGNPQCKLVNVNSHSLGVVGFDKKLRQKVNAVLIPKNTQLPARASRTFVTARDGQRDVLVPVVEGESHRPENCIKLGKCVVQNLPPDLPAGTPIEVEYRYGGNGCVSVSARVPSARQSAHVEIERALTRNLEDLPTWKARLCGLSSPRQAPRRSSGGNQGRLDVAGYGVQPPLQPRLRGSAPRRSKSRSSTASLTQPRQPPGTQTRWASATCATWW